MSKPEDLNNEELTDENLDEVSGGQGAGGSKAAPKKLSRKNKGFADPAPMTVPYASVAPLGLDCVHGGPNNSTD